MSVTLAFDVMEYSFRRGLMQNYEHFGICTSQALDYTCQYLVAG